ncbi:MAG: DUF6285 domain-containing protein [Myxococcota bacterium]|nr:DUF6285 domain-containing protein [Myxococcota bacterium]
MIDRPDAATLLRAMAETLSKEVLPAADGVARHSVRVIANLCRILERELADGSAGSELTRRALAELLGRDGSLAELARALDARLVESPDDVAFASRAHGVILDDVRRRLAIDKPGYEGRGAGG